MNQRRVPSVPWNEVFAFRWQTQFDPMVLLLAAQNRLFRKSGKAKHSISPCEMSWQHFHHKQERHSKTQLLFFFSRFSHSLYIFCKTYLAGLRPPPHDFQCGAALKWKANLCNLNILDGSLFQLRGFVDSLPSFSLPPSLKIGTKHTCRIVQDADLLAFSGGKFVTIHSNVSHMPGDGQSITPALCAVLQRTPFLVGACLTHTKWIKFWCHLSLPFSLLLLVLS